MSERSGAVRRNLRRSAVAASLLLVLALAALYVARKVIARDVLLGWLRSHGVAAEGEVQGLGLNRFTGRLRAGDPNAPDFMAGDATVTYGLRGLGVEVRSVTLRHPVLRARLHDGRLTFGQLDPLIEAFAHRPSQPGAPSPRIEIDGGTLLLATDYGLVRLSVSARVQDGRLATLDARSDPARLHGEGFDVALGRGAAAIRTHGQRTELTLDAPVERLQAPGVTATAARLQLTGAAPYPDTTRKRVHGPVSLHAHVVGGALAVEGLRLESPALDASFQGHADGAFADLSLGGAIEADVLGSGAALAGVRLGAVRAKLAADDLLWTRKGADALAATPEATLALQDLAAGDLRLAQLRAKGRGPVRYGPDGVEASVTASLDGHGAWAGLGAVRASDAASLAAIKRAAQGFQVVAPAVTLSVKGGEARLALPQPLRLRADRGGTLTVSGRGGGPVLGPQGGALRVALRGGGLPALDADVRRLRIAGGAVTAQGEVRATGSVGPVEHAAAEVAGTLRMADGAVSFAAAGCAPVSAARVAFGANDLEHIAGRLCPSGGPAFSLDGGRWRLSAEARDLAADAPFLQARIEAGAGRFDADGSGGRIEVTATLAARLIDQASATRFNPVRLDGSARLADARWTATFRAATPAGAPLVHAKLRHDTRSGDGGLTLDTGPLVFADGGLEPGQISPLAEAIGSPVVGRAAFAGRLDWTPQGVTSGGTLSVAGLDFASPLGRVSGLKGAVAFASLAPLVTGPGQTLTARRLDAAVPLTDLSATFGLSETALTVTGGAADVGGGRLRIERLSVPLAAGAATDGAVTLDAVQLHDLVEASPFGDRVDLDAKVSGRIPFHSEGAKIRISGAELHAIQPGRLSINRHALTAVDASGSVGGPQGTTAVTANDTFTDFAYQAMENLAFDKLNAAIDSRPDGRLGVLAHIVGRHDPPTRQEIRISIFDLIGRKFLNRPLPLPSGTGVDLTLDTTLNLDDLVADYESYRKLRSSSPVQAGPARTESKPLETPR